MLQGSWERTHGEDRNWDRYNNMELLFQTMSSIIVDVLCVTGWFFVCCRPSSFLWMFQTFERAFCEIIAGTLNTHSFEWIWSMYKTGMEIFRKI